MGVNSYLVITSGSLEPFCEASSQGLLCCEASETLVYYHNTAQCHKPEDLKQINDLLGTHNMISPSSESGLNSFRYKAC